MSNDEIIKAAAAIEFEMKNKHMTLGDYFAEEEAKGPSIEQRLAEHADWVGKNKGRFERENASACICETDEFCTPIKGQDITLCPVHK